MSELIGKKIANRLKALGKTQEWLAEIAKVSINAVSKWTKTGKISRENLPVVAEALGLSLDELFTQEPVAPQLPAETKLERLDAEEADIIARYRQCSDPQRRVVRDQLEIFTKPAGRTLESLSTRNKP
jgi:transcriptional regulator with XRE-family HTH domain